MNILLCLTDNSEGKYVDTLLLLLTGLIIITSIMELHRERQCDTLRIF